VWRARFSTSPRGDGRADRSLRADDMSRGDGLSVVLARQVDHVVVVGISSMGRSGRRIGWISGWWPGLLRTARQPRGGPTCGISVARSGRCVPPRGVRDRSPARTVDPSAGVHDSMRCALESRSPLCVAPGIIPGNQRRLVDHQTPLISEAPDYLSARALSSDAEQVDFSRLGRHMLFVTQSRLK
jgi:hypothetical protein